MTETDPLPRSKIQTVFTFPHQIKIVPNRVTPILQGSFWKVKEVDIKVRGDGGGNKFVGNSCLFTGFNWRRETC